MFNVYFIVLSYKFLLIKFHFTFVFSYKKVCEITHYSPSLKLFLCLIWRCLILLVTICLIMILTFLSHVLFFCNIVTLHGSDILLLGTLLLWNLWRITDFAILSFQIGGILSYCLSKKSWPNLYGRLLLYKIGHSYLVS